MIFENEADWKVGMREAIVQGLIDAIYFWGSSKRYVIINPELVRLIQKCGWQKLVSAVSHGKSAKVFTWKVSKGQRLVFKAVSRSRYCLRVALVRQ